MLTQSQKVLAHLSSGRTITALEALQNYGIMQLPRRIWDLRNAGYGVQAERKTVTNRFGQKVVVSEYSLQD